MTWIGWPEPGGTATDLQKIKEGVTESRRELRGIKKKIQEEKKRVEVIQQKEVSVISQLNTLDQNLTKKEKEKKGLDQQLAVLAQKVQRANQDLHSLNRVISSQETFLESRLVALYKFGEAGWPQDLFSSRSSADVLRYQRYLAAVMEQDRQLINDFRKRQDLVEDYRGQLREDERNLQRLRKKTEQKRAEIRKDRKGKGQLLDAVRGQKRVHVAVIKELETASTQLQGLIDRLERQIRAKAQEPPSPPPSGKGFATLRGKLIFPVEGRILSTFGKNENPKFNTFTVQKGIEIEAPLGTEIRAIHQGRVLYSDWFKGYGKILIMDHGDGYYTLFGYASNLLKKVGDDVRAGETVALVGDTGSLKGPCLYFEIRHRGKPLDPLEWLAYRKGR